MNSPFATPEQSFRLRLSRLAGAALVAAATLLSACNDEVDPNICTSVLQGCARIHTSISLDSVPLPPGHLVELELIPVRNNATWPGTKSTVETVGASDFNVYLEQELTPASVDTVTVWVVARLKELPIPPASNVPLKTVAIDSVLHVLRVSRRGAPIVPTTVQLRLHKP